MNSSIFENNYQSILPHHHTFLLLFKIYFALLFLFKDIVCLTKKYFTQLSSQSKKEIENQQMSVAPS